jgi:hypothetical protein
MWPGLLLAFALVNPAGAREASQSAITLELRIFNGAEEVTSQTRVTVHRAAERDAPVVQLPTGSPRLEVEVPEGFYDVQAIREREGRVLNIRWALRLVVMRYPDEAGRHLEVINFQNGFGALQVRSSSRARPAAAVYKTSERNKEAATALDGSGYVLFILLAGSYDLQMRNEKGIAWHTNIEVPLDRTRLLVVP